MFAMVINLLLACFAIRKFLFGVEDINPTNPKHWNNPKKIAYIVIYCYGCVACVYNGVLLGGVMNVA